MKYFGERPGKSRRQHRVEEQVKRILGEIFRGGANDPRIGFVSILRVETGGDLKKARVYVSVLGDEAEVEQTLEGLQSARSYFQRELARRMTSRYTPVISFALDPTPDYDARIAQLLAAARAEEGGDAGPA